MRCSAEERDLPFQDQLKVFTVRPPFWIPTRRLTLQQTPRGACLNDSITQISDSRHRLERRFRHINIYDLSEFSAMGGDHSEDHAVGWLAGGQCL
jgi:hypothetical protein